MAIPEIQIDPRNENELLIQATEHAQSVSGGTLINFTPGDPLTALIEGQVYAGSELLWYVNKLPKKLAAYWLSSWGFDTTIGSYSSGTLTVYLTSALPNDLEVGVLTVSDGSQLFKTVGTFTITAGQLQGTVGVKAEDRGSNGNVPPFTLTRLISRYPFIRSVANETALTGGTDPVSDEEVLSKAVDRVRSNQLISARDYEVEALKFLGADQGWLVRVIPNLGANGQTDQFGRIGVLLGNPRLASIGVGTVSVLTDYLRSLAPISIDPWVGLLQRVDLQFVIYAKYPDTDDAPTIADNLRAEILRLLSSGDSILQNDLVVACSRAGCDLTIGTINGQSDWVTSNRLTVPHPKYLEFQLIGFDEYTKQQKNRTDINAGRLFVFGDGDEV